MLSLTSGRAETLQLLCPTAKKEKSFTAYLRPPSSSSAFRPLQKIEILLRLLVPSASSTDADRQEASKGKGPRLKREPRGSHVFSGPKNLEGHLKKRALKLLLSCLGAFHPNV